MTTPILVCGQAKFPSLSIVDENKFIFMHNLTDCIQWPKYKNKCTHIMSHLLNKLHVIQDSMHPRDVLLQP